MGKLVREREAMAERCQGIAYFHYQGAVFSNDMALDREWSATDFPDPQFLCQAAEIRFRISQSSGHSGALCLAERLNEVRVPGRAPADVLKVIEPL